MRRRRERRFPASGLGDKDSVSVQEIFQMENGRGKERLRA
jgi:hypothetical protein